MFHIVFWFIKQFYYILKRFTKHKILLLACVGLFVYFIFTNVSFGAYYNPYNIIIANNSDSFLSQMQRLPEFNDNYTYITYIGVNPNDPTVFDTPYISFFDISNCSSHLFYFVSTFIGRDYADIVFRGYTSLSSIPKVTYRFNGSSFVDRTVSAVTSSGGGGAFRYGDNVSYYTDSDNSILVLNCKDKVYTSQQDINTDKYIYSGDDLTYLPVPFIVNASDIPTWNFSRLLINTDGLTLPLPSGYTGNWQYHLIINYPINFSLTIDIMNYFLIDEIGAFPDRVYYFSIPANIIKNQVYLTEASSYNFVLARENPFNDDVEYYDLGTYTLELSSSAINTINNNTNAQNIGSITDDNVNISLNNLPTDDSEDITRDGINNIFTSIYDNFCSPTVTDISFNIPFTSSQITISSDLTRTFLTQANLSVLIYIIEAFWWYIISRFIIKDILNKITKIKSGDLENMQNTNIKGDML